MSRKAAVTFVLLFSLTGVYAGVYSGGVGSAENPFQIATPEDLNEIGDDPCDWDKHFILTVDINMADYTYSTALVAPDINDSNFGFQGTSFTGVFEGNDHKIIKLTINTEEASNDYLGLFGRIDGGTIKNLGIEDCNNITGRLNSHYLGGLCGENNGTISNCYSTGFVSGDYYVGGLSGVNGGTIEHCYSTGSFSSDGFLGGLCGQNYYGTIINCYGESTLTGTQYLGGLCGSNFEGIISNCYAEGTIIGGVSSDHLGGLCGSNSHGGTIEHCAAKCSITGGDGSYYIGGLCGGNHESTVNNCHTISSVNGGDDSYWLGGLAGTNFGVVSNSYSGGEIIGYEDIGGLIGFNAIGRGGAPQGSVYNCYSTSMVTGTVNVGAITGSHSSGEYTSCFWDEDLNPDVNGVGTGSEPNVIGLPTAEMMKEDTFTDAGWDFVGETVNGPNDIWTIKEDVNYPQHVWPLVQYVDWDGVDFLDYGFFADYYGLTDCNDINDCNSSDLDFSGAVDINDVNIFTTYWLFGKK